MEEMTKKKERMQELCQQLNRAAEVYYKESNEIMSNLEYDKLYDELVSLESETGITLAGSPTMKVGYEVLKNLPKEEHPTKMLSLDKTKSVDELVAWLGDKEGLLSWKLDGLTVVLTYENGSLSKAVTRGNGVVGEVITNNAKVFKNLPITIPFKGRLVLRGEAFIKYSDFEKINNTIEDVDAKYKNPRNLCSGSVRQLNSEITAKRNVNFMAFSLTEISNGADNDVDDTKEFNFKNSVAEKLSFLKEQGFETVEYVRVNAESIHNAVLDFEKRIADMDIPSDGLVLTYDDIAYGKSLGVTAKFPRNAIAFKWRDEIKETTLREIEWSASRTGLINPIAVFEPVELEGTSVARASVHNVSILRELELGIGDLIKVYKANMIIPQIAQNETRSATCEPPETCPVCGAKTVLKDESGVQTLHCPNPKCPAKKIKAFALFVSRDAMNIENLSEATLEKFVADGYVSSFEDIFRLDRFKDEIITTDGFGEKSYQNMQNAIEKSRNTTAARLLYALGIPGIGVANANMISRACGTDFQRAMSLSTEELLEIDGIGEVMAEAFVKYFADDENKEMLRELLKELTISKESEQGDLLSGKVFVITGSLNHFENRSELKSLIEKNGGKVTSSVTKNTDYLINNDANSTSSKNKKAKELGVAIISEEIFLEEFKDVKDRQDR